MHNAAPLSAPSPSWPRRIVRLLLVFVVIVVAAGFLYQNVSEARDRRFNRMPGRRYDAGGFKMHIDCTGQGTPAVILESGLGDTYLSWRKVQPEIAKFTRVCSYDRAGLGYSESASGARTSKIIAEQLHALLQAAAVPPPYVLVGHSMGGFDVRLYTSLFRGEIAGMVLVDSSHPDQDNRFPPEVRNMEGTWIRESEFLEYTMPFGLPRILGFCDQDPIVRAAECNWQTARESVAEMKAFSESAAQAAATATLGDMPLIVLSHDPDKPSAELPEDVARTTNSAWEKMQEELARLSTRGTQAIAKNSGHYIQLDRPDLVIDAVRRVLDETKQPPAPTAKP